MYTPRVQYSIMPFVCLRLTRRALKTRWFCPQPSPGRQCLLLILISRKGIKLRQKDRGNECVWRSTDTAVSKGDGDGDGDGGGSGSTYHFSLCVPDFIANASERFPMQQTIRVGLIHIISTQAKLILYWHRWPGCVSHRHRGPPLRMPFDIDAFPGLDTEVWPVRNSSMGYGAAGRSVGHRPTLWVPYTIWPATEMHFIHKIYLFAHVTPHLMDILCIRWAFVINNA